MTEARVNGALPPDPVVIAVDGPSGSGKSSVSREVSRRLGYGYLDTGAAYRVLAWLSLQRGTDRADAPAVIGLLADAAFRPPTDPDAQAIVVEGRDITSEIRTDEVSTAASEIARLTPVREALNAGFREIAASIERPGIVIEGRDITTVVAPDASVRILMVADPEVRAARRAQELGAPREEVVAEAMRRRDASDALVVDFVTAADGVVTVDSSHLDFEQAVRTVLGVIRERTAGRR